MTVIDTLITDRTETDITAQQAVEEKIKACTATLLEVSEYVKGRSKGSYNASDLNRVGEAINYIADRLNKAGYIVSVSPKTDWVGGFESPNIPTTAQLNHYLEQVRIIRGVIPVFADTPQVPADISNDMTLDDANDIEQILVEVDTLINNMISMFRHCGAAVCGGGRLLIR